MLSQVALFGSVCSCSGRGQPGQPRSQQLHSRQGALRDRRPQGQLRDGRPQGDSSGRDGHRDSSRMDQGDSSGTDAIEGQLRDGQLQGDSSETDGYRESSGTDGHRERAQGQTAVVS